MHCPACQHDNPARANFCQDERHRFESTFHQDTGAAIRALFGAPIAHEDLAQRARYAALALRQGRHGRWLVRELEP